MLGFGEGKGREIGSGFWRKKKAGFVFIGFWKRFYLSLFIYLFIFGSRKVFFYVFFLKYCADVENCESFKSFDFIYIWVQLMCALKAHINYSYLEIFYGKMKKL